MLLTFDCMHIDSAATATQAHLRLHATVPSATSARAASAVCTASVGLGRQLIRTRKRRNTNGECVARAPLHTPTADQHTRAAPNRYVRPVGEHWPWCVCVPCTAMSHASTRWYSLLVPSLRWLSVTAQHAIGSATPHSSHPCTSGWRRRWPWTVPLTHPHCYSLLLRLPGRLSAPRADFFPADPLPLCGVGTSSNAFSHASLVRTILHNDTGAYR